MSKRKNNKVSEIYYKSKNCLLIKISSDSNNTWFKKDNQINSFHNESNL